MCTAEATMVSNDQNSPKISSPKMILRVFKRKFQYLHITSVSGHSVHSKFVKLLQENYDPSISRIFRSNFWRVFVVWPNCAGTAAVDFHRHTYITSGGPWPHSRLFPPVSLTFVHIAFIVYGDLHFKFSYLKFVLGKINVDRNHS